MNRIEATAIDSMDESELAEENGDTLYHFQIRVNDEIALWRKRKEKLDDALRRKYSHRSRAERNEGDSGTVHFSDTSVMVRAEARKTVYWDQKVLSNIRKNIADSGDDPMAWIVIKEELRIPEASWNRWGRDSWQQKTFIDARTVKIAESFILSPIEDK